MEEDSLGLGFELSSIHSAERDLSYPERGLVGDPLEQVDIVGGNLNRVLQSFQAIDTTDLLSQRDNMSDMDSQDGGGHDTVIATPDTADPPEFVEW